MHRDLKPANVVLVPEGPRVIDFGLVHLTELPHQTSSRQAIATFEYAAPEQHISLDRAAHPADIFALGATLLFAATQHPPYADRYEAKLARANYDDLTAPLYDVVSRCLCPDEDRRPLLPQLRAEFADRARRAARIGRGRDEFATALPVAVMNLIDTWRGELADFERADLSAQVSTSPRRHDPDAAHRSASVPTRDPVDEPHSPWPPPQPRQTLPLTGSFYRQGPNPGTTLIEPGVAPPPPGDHFPGIMRWKHRFGDWVNATVTVANGIAVAGCLDGTVAGFGADDDGTVRWSLGVGAAVRSSVLLLTSERSRAGGSAYAGDADGGLHLIDLESGRHRTLFHASGAIEGSPVGAAGYVYVVSADGCVYQTDMYGSIRQVLFRMDGPTLGAPAVADRTLFASSTEGCVYAIDVATRGERGRLWTDGLVHAAPLPVAGRLYVAGTDGLLRSAEVDNVREHTSVEIGAPVHVAPVHDRGRLYVGSGDGVVRAFDVSGGHRAKPVALWRRQLSDEVNGLAAGGGKVYAAAGRWLLALDGTSGQPGQWFAMESLITGAPAIAGGRVYVAGLGGEVACVSFV